ncbi:outer membrane lipoprotein-sorting protein [candidate division WOR-3 bacterium]|nr:outer membrane lipoprotein-sorting protein [candidate division WOR-3 bacterium]
MIEYQDTLLGLRRVFKKSAVVNRQSLRGSYREPKQSHKRLGTSSRDCHALRACNDKNKYLPRTFLQMSRLILLPFALCSLLFAQSGVEIIAQVDRNTVVSTVSYRAKMLISLGGKIREKEFIGYTKGKEYSYMEFVSPARDKGTRFLKIGDEMWMYIPAVERSTKIAGHMLRQSMMGSDFSYDDVTENKKLQDLYNIEFIGIDTIDNKECYKLELTAKVPEVSYFYRKMWVDKKTYIPVRSELYAKSGKLMKEVSITEYKRIEKKNYPTKLIIVNKLRKDTFTELILEDIELDSKIPAKIFTKAYLERK